MSSFSPSEAGLEGFRVTRENPRAFARWAFFSFAVSVLGAVVTVNMPAEVRDALQTLNAKETPDAGVLLRALVSVAPLMGLGLLIQCMMGAAVYRIILRHDDARFGYLRLGADELRLVALTLIYFVLAVICFAAGLLAAALLAAAASFAGTGAAMVVGGVAELLVMGLAVYVAVRLSLAPVITFDRRRLAVFQSWALTRGRFWPLLGAYVLALACMVVVALLAVVVFTFLAGAVMLALGGEMDMSAIFNPDDTSLATYFNPLMVAYMVMGSVITALYYAVIAAPGAVVYQHLIDGNG